MVGRRSFLQSSAAMIGAALAPTVDAAELGQIGPVPAPQQGDQPGTRLILLGTKGGPTYNAARSEPSQVVVVNGNLYVVDCGAGVAHQLVRAGLSLTRLRHVFITHHHSDHNLDYGNLLYGAWVAGASEPIHTYGPPPLEDMTRLYLVLNSFDIRTRIPDEGRDPIAPLLVPHEYSEPGVILENDEVRVTAALVNHPPVVPAFAYRFDTADRSIVISGDTNENAPDLVKLAQGADVLVHEVLSLRLYNAAPNPNPELAAHVRRAHTPAAEVGKVAKAAGVKSLVLSHFVPSGPDSAFVDEVRPFFDGNIVAGADLMEV